MTEWSITSSAGASGLILVGSPPSLAHGGEVDDAGDAREVLHHDARGRELDLGVRVGLGHPVAEGADLRPGDVLPVLRAEQVLQQHLEAERETLVARHGVDAVDLVVGVPDAERILRAEAVDCRHVALFPRWMGAEPRSARHPILVARRGRVQ
jgi:hypothetical protein